MRCADFVFQFLADHGVRDCFMVSGGGTMFLNDALGQEKRIRHICAHHEQGAAIAAEGYARITGELAVVSVTTGPGGTNALTGVIGQWLDSLPVLYLSGQVKMPTCLASCPELPLRQLGDQEINIVDIVRPVIKYAAIVTEPKKIRFELEKAIYTALSGRRGPVWLDIPINVQSAEIDPSELESFTPPVENTDYPDLKKIPEIIEHLKQAKAPAIIAGHGIRLDNALSEFESVIRKLNIPVLATFEAMDLLASDDPLRIGPIGTIGTRAPNIVLQNADFILCLGSRNNIRQTSYNYENYAKKAKIFAAVDIDPAELKKPTFKPNFPVRSGIRCFLKAFLEALPDTLPDFSGWLNWSQQRKTAYDPVLPEYENAVNGVNPYWITRKLTELLPENAIIACANATPSLALFQAGIVRKGQRQFCNSGCAAMGFGFPASLGAACTGKSECVICLDGDGSMMMNLQELQTAKHYKLPIKLFLYSNNEYASIRQSQDNFFEGRHTGCDMGSGVSFPDWQKVAAAFGLEYAKIESVDTAEKQIMEILNSKEFVFCEIKLTPGYKFAPKLSSRKLPDGSLVSPSLEDMFPFLPEEEMLGNIYRP